MLLFLPAHDESAAIAGVLARVPASVAGHPVRCLVVDDGSTDGTGRLAAAAGAHVLHFSTNHGLGAAVRAGLAEGVACGAAAVAFCDADAEYAPEELERLVAPVLAGQADYVVGSRFATGRPPMMRPHRRLGNQVLTAWVRRLTGLPLTDGQSGYRVLSPAAAAAAEVIHDFNYAQVLTLDLVGKGFRYAEVPISYRFRTTGRSFVKLLPYLRRVIPAVRAQQRATASASATAITGAPPTPHMTGRDSGRHSDQFPAHYEMGGSVSPRRRESETHRGCGPRPDGRSGRGGRRRGRRPRPWPGRGGCCQGRTGPDGRS